MAENNTGVSAEVLKRTKATLGTIITKPPLTDKLLQRPPFKYLHDIITEVMKTTGYFKDLFTGDELDHSKITNKDQKIAFLQKIIDVIVMASGESLKVRPSKVVAGHEAERTNEFLQVLSKVITNKVDCSNAVQKVLKGEKPPEKERRKRPAVAEQSKSRPPDKAKQQHTTSASKSTERKEKQAPASGASSSTNMTSGTSSQQDDQKVDTVRSRPKAADKDGRKDPLESSSLSGKSTNNLQSLTGKDSKDSRHKEHKSRSNRKDKHRSSKEEEQTKSSSTTEVKEPIVNGEVHENEQPPELERPPPARGKRKTHHSDSKEPTHPVEALVNEDEAVHSNGQGSSSALVDDQAVKEPQRSSSPPLPPMNIFPQGGRRPGSARPAPPKIVRHTEEEPQDIRITSGNAKLNVILDNNKDDENEEENFFVEDTARLPEEPIVNGELVDAKPEGALTKKMMLNKELLQGELPTDASSTEQPRISEAQRKKEREMIAKEIEQLQSSIQGLCRSATPLGRVMDYVQEDMDSMLKELELWQKESSQHKEALQREQSITDQELQPLRAQLEELDSRLSQQVALTRAIKANILKNDEKIQQMLSGMTLSGQS